MFKLEYHSKFRSFIGSIFFRFFNCNTRTLSYCEQVILRKYFFIHFLQIFMYVRTILYIRGCLPYRPPCTFPSGSPSTFDIILITSMRKPSIPFSHHQFIIEKTSSRTFGLSQFKSGLFFRKQMQIIHICCFIINPGRTVKYRTPVIRFFSVFPFSPDVIVTIWIFS